VQALGEVHDTPLNWAPVTLGVCWIDHVVPFHASASGALLATPVAWPTAMQKVAEAQETPVRLLEKSPWGLGVRWTDHAVPFHDSARVTSAPAMSRRWPTAMQALGGMHDTAFSRPCGISGLGVGCTAQAAPLAGALAPGWRAAGRDAAPAAGAATPARMSARAAPAASGAANLRPARRAVTGETALVI
jgi:hypothetical protein